MKQHNPKHKWTLIVYFLLRILVIACAIGQFFLGNFLNVALCVLSLIFFTLPSIIERKFKIDLPGILECAIYLFIFASEILGEIANFYGLFPGWDTMLHTLNGFLCAAIGFSLFDLLNVKSEHINLSPFYLSLVAFCFSMTIGVLWEFFEFGADLLAKTDTQKDFIVTTISSVKLNPAHENAPLVISDITSTAIQTKNGDTYIVPDGFLDIGLIDTMKDLFVNFLGALVFSIIGFFYVRHRNKHEPGSNFARNFIPRKVKQPPTT